ncbi:DDE-domain-containing protein [Peniophora sp. CONT]|nr:DDE-domain-containing protein [Peniophora sp. CONT]
MHDEVYLSGEIICQKWTRFANLANVPVDERLTLSDGWLTAFKKCCGLCEFKHHDEAASTTWLSSEGHLEYGQDCMPPDRGLMDKQLSGVKGSKSRLTYAVTMNADGSECLPPFIIGKAAKPRAFQKKTGQQLGFLYRNNAKAWMTTVLYQEWICDWDRSLKKDKRTILLLQDNFSGHVPPEDFTNIIVTNFAPNLTAHVQPADADTICAFKAHYHRFFMQRSLDRYDQGITPSAIYALNQLEAMRLADLACKAVTQDTIANCWKKTGILPELLLPSTGAPASIVADSTSTPSSDPLTEAEQSVSDSLDALEARSVLQKSNCVDLEELVNAVAEQITTDDTSEENICEAVKQWHAAENVIDVDDDDDEATPMPTRREALGAVATLQQYVAGLDGNFARRMEQVLTDFGRQTRLEETKNLKETTLT